MVNWKRRSVAFFIDYIIFQTLWGIIDNVIIFPISEIILSFISAFLFCVYFVLTEATGKTKTSLGKSFLKISTLGWNGKQPSLKQIFSRSAIVAALLILDWSNLIKLLPTSGIPMIFFIALTSVQFGLLIYNGWLAVKGFEGLMIQDILTNSKVVLSTAVINEERKKTFYSSDELKRKLSKPIVFFLTTTFVFLVIVSFNSLTGQNILSPIQQKNKNVKIIMEKAIADEFSIRSRIDIKSITHYEFSTKESSRSLKISVWIPYAAWNNDLIIKYVEVVVKPLKIEPGFFKSGQIKIGTGFRYLSIYKSFKLNLP